MRAVHPTAREIEVLELVALGLSNKQIARRLDLSPLTVKAHLFRIAECAGMPANRAGLVGWAFRGGYLT